jgi:hypothetical protein
MRARTKIASVREMSTAVANFFRIGSKKLFSPLFRFVYDQKCRKNEYQQTSNKANHQCFPAVAKRFFFCCDKLEKIS